MSSAQTRGMNVERSTGLAETFVLLDDSSGRGPSHLFTDPVGIIAASMADDVPGALREAQAAIDSGHYVAGFLSYELGYVLEPRLLPLLPDLRTVPLIWLGIYNEPQRLQSGEVDTWLADHLRSGSYEFRDVMLGLDRTAYLDRFARVKDRIVAGDIYQLNLTFKARFTLSGSPLTFYRDLRRRQRVSYAGIVDTGDVTVLSASPELFFEQRGREITTRPMKGTAPRAGLPELDRAAATALAADIKQRAENLMIVDLMRNDIGRLAETGGVSVTDLFTVETYQTLHQMTSGVRATLRPDVSVETLMKAVFPPGSVTGAPKVRAMELIREYEAEPRGVYCGAMGFLAPSGDVLFNVAIRTPVVFRDGRGEMGIGSGVVYDSEGPKEYAECLLKMKFLTDPPKPFQLIETMLFEPGEGIALIERHLARLEASSRYFGFRFARSDVRQAIEDAVMQDSEQRRRLRLLLSEDGIVSIGATPQPVQSEGTVWRYLISPTRLSSSDAFLFHKTTRRDLYDREHAQFAADYGVDEVLYLNEHGHLAEGSRTNIFIDRDGRLETPPVASGLLPGTLRAHLIATGRAVERLLLPGDLESADAVYVGNSVRGLVRAIKHPAADARAERVRQGGADAA